MGCEDLLQANLGYVPSLFRVQSAVAGLMEAGVALTDCILFQDHGLTRLEKERILLAMAARQGNAYCAAAHAQMLWLLGTGETVVRRLAQDYRNAGLPGRDVALIDFCLGGPITKQQLCADGWSTACIQDAALTAALAAFFCRMSAGLALPPEFEPPPFPPGDWTVPAAPEDWDTFDGVDRPGLSEAVTRFRTVVTGDAEPAHLRNMAAGAAQSFLATLRLRLSGDVRILNPQSPPLRPTVERAVPADPDSSTVARAKQGDLDAFEQLVNAHARSVFRTLIGLLDNAEESKDAMQDTFLKAFQHLGTFQGNSRFSTWLISIAVNTGIQRLRERRPWESLDETGEENFRPRQVRTWAQNPEQLYSRDETRRLVEENVRRLPARYRVAVVLRDIEQLSTEEAAAALGIGVPALKSRVLRGRLMLREALTRHFSEGTA